MANLGADVNALALARAAELRTHKGPVGETLPPGEAPTLRAPCCGRKTDQDCVLDVRMVPGIAHDFLCDACQHRLIADKQNEWTRSKLARAAGLGWAEVREHRIRELMTDEIRLKGRIDRSEAHTRINGELPDRDIPGTEAPPGVVSIPRKRGHTGRS